MSFCDPPEPRCAVVRSSLAKMFYLNVCILRYLWLKFKHFRVHLTDNAKLLHYVPATEWTSQRTSERPVFACASPVRNLLLTVIVMHLNFNKQSKHTVRQFKVDYSSFAAVYFIQLRRLPFYRTIICDLQANKNRTKESTCLFIPCEKFNLFDGQWKFTYLLHPQPTCTTHRSTYGQSRPN